MRTFAVIREAGPTWADERGLLHQPAVGPHSAFMNGLAEGGLLLLGGPLSGTEDDRIRVLLIVNAESEAEVERRLADDPWARTGQLRTVSIEPWRIFVGAERLTPSVAA